MASSASILRAGAPDANPCFPPNRNVRPAAIRFSTATATAAATAALCHEPASERGSEVDEVFCAAATRQPSLKRDSTEKVSGPLTRPPGVVSTEPGDWHRAAQRHAAIDTLLVAPALPGRHRGDFETQAGFFSVREGHFTHLAGR